MTPTSETYTQLLRRRAGERALGEYLKDSQNTMVEELKGHVIIVDNTGKEMDWWKR